MLKKGRNQFQELKTSNSIIEETKKEPEEKVSLKWSLEFNNREIETEYKKSIIGYQVYYFRIFQIYLLMVLFSVLIINPYQVDYFNGISLTINLANLCLGFFVTIYFYYNKNFQYPSTAVLLLQIFTVTIFIEGNLDLIRSKFTTSSFITVTFFLETVMLISMISRCSWKINFISSLILNIYLNIRYTTFKENIELKGLPTITHIVNVIFITMCSYFHDKYDRTLFYKRYISEQSLRRYEEILRQVLPTSIVIYRHEEIIFNNEEAVRVLDINDNNPIEERLKMISVSENKINQINIKTEPQFNQNESYNKVIGDTSIFSYFSHFMTSNNSKDFIHLTGTLNEMEELHPFNRDCEQKYSKYFDIKIGRILWDGKNAIIAILAEDFATQRLFDLQEQANYKDKLLATVSHDLRTPLNGVIGILDLALEGILEKDVRKSLQLALRSSNLLLFMINDILDFSQISKGTLSLNPISFDVEEMIKEATNLIKFQAKKKGIELIIESKLQKYPRKTFINDPNRLKQVILNLLGNALKFTQTGFIKISVEEFISEINPIDTGIVELNIQLKESTPLKFTVTDSGSGIKQEDIPKLFKLFGMLKNEETRKVNTTGVGLGLAISQQLVIILNNHRKDGIISVESELGKGSVFSFLLYPQEENRKEELNLRNSKSSAFFQKGMDSFSNDEYNFILQENEVKQNNNPNIFDTNSNQKLFNQTIETKKVLLVDDDQINILVLTKIFERFKDCEISLAQNGEEAVRIVKDNSKNKIFFNIIFMDCNMPVMDGFEATKRIIEMVNNEEIPKVAIIASTANVLKSDQDYCFKCGMIDIISKPFTKQKLREKVDLYS